MNLGIYLLLGKKKSLIEGRRIGVLAHAASFCSSGEHTVKCLMDAGGVQIAALFGPEHGVSTSAQDMEAVENSKDTAIGVPVYSLYGKTTESLRPQKHMLADLDAVVVDLQDIGSRYYTYVWTAVLCAEACAKFGKKMIVCDRPNPIDGTTVEGDGIAKGFESFVGLHSVPVRHGMTIGEIVKLICDRQRINVDLTVVEMEGWRRDMSWGDTDINWVNPSPNMRSYTAALLYPGTCLIEGTNISEGRGTDTPFELVGAPYVDSEELIGEFNRLGLGGIDVAPTAFIPTRQKWKGALCRGVRWIVKDPNEFRPYLTGLVFIWLAHRFYKDKGFEWRKAPYEFVTDKPAIDLLTGSSRFRENITTLSLGDLEKMATTPEDMLEERAKHLIYR